MDHSRPHGARGGERGSIVWVNLSFGERLWHAPLPLTSWLAGGMLLWHSPQRSRCSHSHLLLLLLHLVLQELQLCSAGKEMGGKKTKLAEGISVCCYKRQNAHVACVSEAELQPGMANKRSVQTNTQEWLMGCRGRRRGGESWGREGSEAGHSQAAPGGALELQIIGCDLRSETCSTATMLSAQSKSATSTGNRQQHLRIHAHSVTACHLWSVTMLSVTFNSMQHITLGNPVC